MMQKCFSVIKMIAVVKKQRVKKLQQAIYKVQKAQDKHLRERFLMIWRVINIQTLSKVHQFRIAQQRKRVIQLLKHFLDRCTKLRTLQEQFRKQLKFSKKRCFKRNFNIWRHKFIRLRLRRILDLTLEHEIIPKPILQQKLQQKTLLFARTTQIKLQLKHKPVNRVFLVQTLSTLEYVKKLLTKSFLAWKERKLLHQKAAKHLIRSLNYMHMLRRLQEAIANIKRASKNELIRESMKYQVEVRKLRQHEREACSEINYSEVILCMKKKEQDNSMVHSERDSSFMSTIDLSASQQYQYVTPSYSQRPNLHQKILNDPALTLSKKIHSSIYHLHLTQLSRDVSPFTNSRSQISARQRSREYDRQRAMNQIEKEIMKADQRYSKSPALIRMKLFSK
ncbi:hypothetical protein FGO68_gene3560 [Halteria grandinella]|uniref:Uncharacterized protein n=1 Tax=Halteria grandinella TaxID=5974 RepID=A0A8J8T2I2_HALGN|nr:hypothetical protein FGO68_gene3560 [Halteria grandinella]